MKDLPSKSFNFNCVLLLFFSIFLCISLCITMSIQIYLTEPRFVLRHATVKNFNLTAGGGPNLLTTNISVALAACIPSRHRGIYYDRLDVYAAYRNLILTLPAPFPASYQGYKDVAFWSAFLIGNSVPVDPGVGMEVRQGEVLVNIIVDGRIRKRFWNIEVGPCRLSANCSAYLKFGSSIKSSSPVENCHVEVHDYY